MEQREFAEVLSSLLGARGKGEHILSINTSGESPAGLFECDLSVNGKLVKIKVSIAMRNPSQVRADVLAQLPDH